MQERYRKSIQTRRNNGRPWHTEESKLKISQSEKGKDVSKETIKKLKLAWTEERKKKPNRKGTKHSQSARSRISEATKAMWTRGAFDRKDYRSKMQIEVEETFKKMGYEVKSEYFVGGKPYDIHIPEINLIVEFNGTYWHLDERVYGSDFYDESRSIHIQQVKKRDQEKLNIAKSQGYKVLVIWELDWKSSTNKEEFIRKELNNVR